LLSLPSHDEYFLSTEQSSGSTRIAVGDNSPISEGRLASNLASRVMSPGKHPPEGAQNGTLTPAIGRAAAPHGAHALNKTLHDSEEQIQAQDPPNHPPHHVTSCSPGVPPVLSMDPTGIHRVSCQMANLSQAVAKSTVIRTLMMGRFDSSESADLPLTDTPCCPQVLRPSTLFHRLSP
jgi:hypothetical protein